MLTWTVVALLVAAKEAGGNRHTTAGKQIRGDSGCLDVVTHVTITILHAHNKGMKIRYFLSGNGGHKTAVETAAAKRTHMDIGIGKQPFFVNNIDIKFGIHLIEVMHCYKIKALNRLNQCSVGS